MNPKKELGAWSSRLTAKACLVSSPDICVIGEESKLTVYESAPAYENIQKIDYFEKSCRWTIRGSRISDGAGHRL